MLKIFQIIALIQGIFLIIVLLKNRSTYKSINFYMLLLLIFSMLCFILGDDEYNLFIKETNWFFFHETFFITSLYFYVTTFYTKKHITIKHLVILIPYLIYNTLHLIKLQYDLNQFKFFYSLKLINELAIFCILAYCTVTIIQYKGKKWMLLFLIPLTIIYTIDEFTSIFYYLNNNKYKLDSYGIFSIVLTFFYILLFKYIFAPKDIIKFRERVQKYKSSVLKENDIKDIIRQLEKLMIDDKVYKDSKITVNEVAKKLAIQRNQLSEVLNVHLQNNFQDYINNFRVDEFINLMKNPDYNNYTLLGIAFEVGFNSKSSFYNTFKKIKGTTPKKYKQQLKNTTENSPE